MESLITNDDYAVLVAALSPCKCIAVSKNRAASLLRKLYAYGQIDFAESYLQEMLQKKQELSDLEIIWHFIGRIQSRKCKFIAKNFSWVHSINSIEQLKLMDKYRAGLTSKLKCLLQVTPDNIYHAYALSFTNALPCIIEFANIEVVGVMAMPSAGSDIAQINAVFEAVANFARSNWDQPVISMGMSSDYPLAINQGANMVRLGGLLFNK